ncbi:MAG: hypothetical protein RLY50_565 [Actinomycetota bacterium]
MTVSEKKRLELLLKLRNHLGVELADELSEFLLPVGWSDLAQSRELTAVHSELSSDIKVLRSDLALVTRDIETLREDLKGVRAEIKDIRAEIKDIRAEIKDVRNDMRDGFARISTTIRFMVGGSITVGAALIATMVQLSFSISQL